LRLSLLNGRQISRHDGGRIRKRNQRQEATPSEGGSQHDKWQLSPALRQHWNHNKKRDHKTNKCVVVVGKEKPKQKQLFTTGVIRTRMETSWRCWWGVSRWLKKHEPNNEYGSDSCFRSKNSCQIGNLFVFASLVFIFCAHGRE
jgi:hypothetical protein